MAWKIVALLPGTYSTVPPMRDVTTSPNTCAMAWAPVQDGTPILTSSAVAAATEAAKIAVPNSMVFNDIVFSPCWFIVILIGSAGIAVQVKGLVITKQRRTAA